MIVPDTNGSDKCTKECKRQYDRKVSEEIFLFANEDVSNASD